jgi:Spy/CpxP family protein refolding chaperone
MTKTKLTHLILGGVLATSLAASSFAIFADPSAPQQGQMPPMPHEQKGPHQGGLLLNKVADRINLSPEQRAQVKQIMDANRATVQGIHEKMDANQMEIRKLTLSDEKGKDGKIEQLARMQGKLVTKMIVNNAKVTDEMRHLLTPDQVEQIKHIGGGPVSKA